MNEVITIIKSNILRHPKIIWTVLKNIPTLEPFILFANIPVYVLYKDDSIIGFVCIKKWNSVIELGGLYISKLHRGHGYAELLCKKFTDEYPDAYLLCRPDLIPMYSHFGFSVIQNAPQVMQKRQKLNSWFIAPFVGYKIVIMKHELK